MSFTLSKNSNVPNGVSGNGKTLSAGADSGSITTACRLKGVASTPKLTDMSQQSSTTQAADSTIAGGGNFITAAQVATYGPQGAALGYSILGE